MSKYPGYFVSRSLNELQAKLKGTSLVRPASHSLSELFTLVFRERFVASGPAGRLEGGEYVASRANWTYYTALSVHSAAQTLNLNCRFEVMGRLDAVIETREAEPQVMLVAEWEFDHRDVFGKGKELPKLRRRANELRGADALLFTYCPLNEYPDWARAVVEYWQGKRSRRSHASLFAPVMVYEKQGSLETLMCFRTIQVLPSEVVLWDDI